MAEHKKFINELHDPTKYIKISEEKVGRFIIEEYIHNLPPEETEKRRREIAKQVLKILAED